MSVPDKLVRLVLVFTLAFGVLAVVPEAEAAVVKPFALNFNKTLYGDFVYAGNGALRCPVPDDRAPTTGSGNTPAACAGGANRDNTTVNDNYFMQWSDVDADPGTFDSSRARVTVPPGAKVEFARLNWAGNTGIYNTRAGVPSPIRMCQSRNFDTAAVLPAGSPGTQPVRLTVGSGDAQDIAPASYAEDPSNTHSGGQYYSAYADVTSAFSGVATGAPVELTVGNVWAPKGFGCMGGWSVAVVYSYPEANAQYAPSKREVFVYDGHVRQNSTDPTTNVDISGFRAAAADAHVGVTAYEGDWGIPRDTFLINDQPAFEPATGDASNFFISNADGASGPAVQNNYSVDAKSFTTTSIPAGATSVKIGFSTGGDAYLAQNLAFSLPVPELQITKTADPKVVHPGDPVTFTITVTNPSGAPASDVQVEDPLYPDCSRVVGNLAGGGSQTYTCTGAALADDFTNTAKVTGKGALGDPLEGTASAFVDVIHPAVGITKTADKPAYRAGDTVTFTIAVTNTGDVPLSSVRIDDPKAAGCARTLPGTLVAGQKSTFTCTTTAPVADDMNTASVTADDPLGRAVSASADAPVPLIAPAIDVVKTASPTTIHAGEQVTWTVTVRNTGDSPLDPVQITDDTTAACSRTLPGPLAAGASETYTCTANPSATTTNTVTTTGTDQSGQQVTDSASATVAVINPALAITKDATPAVVRTGDQVTFSITVRNSGDVPLADVSVVDDRTPECARTFGTLAAGASQTYTCTATAPADDFTNTATATGKDPIGKELTVTDDAVVDVIHPAITITKDAAPAQVREGDMVTFTITVQNSGDVPLADVSVVDDRTPGCARTFGTLAVDGTQTYTCTTVAGATGFTNTATATGTDPTSRPVTATDTAGFTVQHPGLGITKVVQGGPFRAEDSVTFEIVVTNTGDVPLTGITVTDPVAPECARTFEELAAGEVRRYECTMTAPEDDVVNVARVTGTPPTGPPVAGEDDARVDVIHPAVRITKDADPAQVRAGERVTFTIAVTNTGDVPLADVSVVDDRTPACGFTLATLAPGATETRTCAITATQDITNTATVTGDDPTGRPVTGADDASVDVIGPGITVAKTGPAKPVLPGQQVAFTVVVTNTGDVPLTGVTLDDPAAPGCTVRIGDLAVGASSAPITCEVTMGEEDIPNTATAKGNDPTGRPVTATDDALALVAEPGLDVTKKADGETVAPGAAVTFTLTATNTGNVDLTPVQVADPTLPVCDRSFDRLPVGEHRTWTCTTTAPGSGELVNTATGTGTPDTEQPGTPVTDSATAKVLVTPPEPGGPNPPPGQPGPDGPNPPPGQPAPGPGRPKPALAKTGADPLFPAALGLALLAAGAALVLISRRRSRG
ncbi:DUF7507 domain-containing protein [Amycolatopsis nigrescens]|uniref:DUF7507 domain-containing protein n=1 Tax=Amycolatopsis nigrescens TaxID=381445 RepID=UPI00036556C2|nr:LPXTG cell wall anchor domain-containing protein [Amycolatopsis nigrescens]